MVSKSNESYSKLLNEILRIVNCFAKMSENTFTKTNYKLQFVLYYTV